MIREWEKSYLNLRYILFQEKKQKQQQKKNNSKWVQFCAEIHPPSKFCGNVFVVLCNPADKTTNQQTDMVKKSLLWGEFKMKVLIPKLFVRRE